MLRNEPYLHSVSIFKPVVGKWAHGLRLQIVRFIAIEAIFQMES